MSALTVRMRERASLYGPRGDSVCVCDPCAGEYIDSTQRVGMTKSKNTGAEPPGGVMGHRTDAEDYGRSPTTTQSRLAKSIWVPRQ